MSFPPGQVIRFHGKRREELARAALAEHGPALVEIIKPGVVRLLRTFEFKPSSNVVVFSQS